MQNSSITDKGHGTEFRWYDDDSRASWKAYGKGACGITFETNENTGHLSLVAHETAFAEKIFDEKRDTTKEVMMTLDAEQARALLKFLRNHVHDMARSG